MGDGGGHHYTVEIRPVREASGGFRWLIRDRGKILRGVYRPQPSAAVARALAEAEIDRLEGRDGSL